MSDNEVLSPCAKGQEVKSKAHAGNIHSAMSKCSEYRL